MKKRMHYVSVEPVEARKLSLDLKGRMWLVQNVIIGPKYKPNGNTEKHNVMLVTLGFTQ